MDLTTESGADFLWSRLSGRLSGLRFSSPAVWLNIRYGSKAESWEGHGRDTIVAQRHSCEPVSVSSEAAESGAYGDDFYEPDAQYFALPAQNRFLH